MRLVRGEVAMKFISQQKEGWQSPEGAQPTFLEMFGGRHGENRLQS